MLTNDAVVLGLLFLILALVFYTASANLPFWKRFYGFVPPILLCYFLPGLLNTFGVVNVETSSLYPVAMRFLLPTSLVLFCLSVDFGAFRRLGKHSGYLFAASALSVMLGGPLAVWLTSLVAPDLVGGQGPNAAWRGLATLAGTWIGGGANQTALREVFKPSDALFSAILTVDVLVGYLWMGLLLYGAGRSDQLDRWLKADASAIEEVKLRVQKEVEAHRRIPTVTDLILILSVGFGATAVAHLVADSVAPFIGREYPSLARFSLDVPFFWLVSVATALGVLGSFTPLRRLEGAGASSIASVFLYLMIATIGLKMNVLAIADHPGLVLVGLLWMGFHALIMIGVTRLLRAPFFFLAVGSQACIGGPASAPVVAAAFHPVLAPVGVLMAIMGYAVGTYLGYVCGILMQWVSGG